MTKSAVCPKIWSCKSMRVGDIYLVENGDIYPPKKKFSICVCVREGYFLLINSENRTMYKCTPILKVDHSFLSYDSFIGCNRFFRYTTEQLEQAKYCGCLTCKELRGLRAHLETISSFAEQDKALILQSIDDALTDED